jgi:hypothetical protein
MARMKQFGFAVAMFIVLSIYPLAAQMAPSPISPRTGVPTTSPRGTAAPQARQQPCWQQAGVSQSAMQQRRQIEESTRGQIESVCSDSSLTPQQKHEKIQQLRQEARQRTQGLVTQQQEQTIKSCREKRGEAPHMSGGHGAGVGPCGEMASETKP